MRIYQTIILACCAVSLVVSHSNISCAQNTTSTCVSCHLELEDELREPAALFSDDVHNLKGVSCAGCHGGDPSAEDAEISMSAANGFVGTPSILQIPEFCGRCHSDPAYMRLYNPSLATDQLEKYWSSHHGELSQKGDKKAAQCISCHSVHNILSASDPRSTVFPKNVPATCAHCHSDKNYMESYGIPVDQYKDYIESVHAIALIGQNDLGAPACNDCHGNHAATPPGISSIGRVCFQCHLAEGELFSTSPHKEAFDDLGVPECAFCHSNHNVQILSDQYVGVDDKAICVECHSEGDAGYEAAKSMQTAIIGLKDKYQIALELIEEAERKGIEVSEEHFKLLDIRQSLINVRAMIHTFNPETVLKSTEEAMQAANNVYQAGLQSIQEVKKRRFGFIIFSLVTLVIVVVIYLRMKEREKSI